MTGKRSTIGTDGAELLCRMDDDLRRQLRDYAWGYFALHADQRIKTFNFFLILCTVISGGLIKLVSDGQGLILGVPVAVALSFVSFIFWRLDIRNKELIDHAESALRLLEHDKRLVDAEGLLDQLKLFTCEAQNTTVNKRRRILQCIPWHFRYTTCFNVVFAFFALSGVVAAILLTIMVFGDYTLPGA